MSEPIQDVTVEVVTTASTSKHHFVPHLVFGLAVHQRRERLQTGRSEQIEAGLHSLEYGISS